jgi:hypothetical protein
MGIVIASPAPIAVGLARFITSKNLTYDLKIQLVRGVAIPEREKSEITSSPDKPR